MKKLALMISAVCCGVTAAAAPLISTTIDFLDYVFEYRGDKNYFPLEEYDRILRELAEGGVKKIYLRVNVCGTTHYPSKVSALYGENDAIHWQILRGSLLLVETYKHYNPLVETIRIGHKYGMQVWAWESLFDDAGVQLQEIPKGTDPRWVEAWKRCDGWALLDPFYRSNMDALAECDPKVRLSDEKIAEINRDARRHPISRIVFTNRQKYNPCRLAAEDLMILVSSDNKTYRKLDKPFNFTVSTTPEGFNRFEITGIEISEPYIKIASRNRFGKYPFSLVLVEQRGQGELYDVTGRKVASVWSWTEGPDGSGMADFIRLRTLPAGIDHATRQFAIMVGETTVPRYFYGMAEFNVPKAMKHKVDRFAELAEYPFDGFMFNIRCHSPHNTPERYGYNPEVRAKYLERHGKDIWREAADVDKLFAIRAEGVADFFKNCKACSGGRPIYLSGPKNPDMGPRAHYGRIFGPLPWLYKRYFTDGSIDGVIMIGDEFPDYFSNEITGGKPIVLGVFREMLYQKGGYNFKADIERLSADPRIKEVELYESRVLNLNPEYFSVIKGTAGADWRPPARIRW